MSSASASEEVKDQSSGVALAEEGKTAGKQIGVARRKANAVI
jgi:hypothetical protein